MTTAINTIVAGSRFGQFYAKGIAEDPHFNLLGILGQGSARSAALAKQLNTRCFNHLKEIPANTQLACIAIGGAARGKTGPAIAKALMDKQIDILIEHPLLPQELNELLSYANSLGRRCIVNSFYSSLPAVEQFINSAQKLHRKSPIRLIEVTCTIQLSYAILDILAIILQATAPTAFQITTERLEAIKEVQLNLAETAISLTIINELAANNDGAMTMLQRIHIIHQEGTLTLTSPHGPILWEPIVNAPKTNNQGLFDIFDQPTKSLPHIAYYHNQATDWSTIYQQLWPSNAVKAAQQLMAGKPIVANQQRTIDVCAIWQELTQALSFPVAPKQQVRPALLESILEN